MLFPLSFRLPRRMLKICRHVLKTGEIKGFVITEESGIAKGIRRIIAVTGQDASDVTRQANALSNRLSQIDKLVGKEKDAEMKDFSAVCKIFLPGDGTPAYSNVFF